MTARWLWSLFRIVLTISYTLLKLILYILIRLLLPFIAITVVIILMAVWLLLKSFTETLTALMKGR